MQTMDLTLKDLIDEALSKLLIKIPSPLKEAASYSLFSGGKRLRPLLALATYEAFGGKGTKILRPACTLELIHTYSLIHDDLPAMDNDDYRRGQLTLHKVVKEGTAILTGDFLLTFAFEVLSTDPDLTDFEKITLIQILSKRAGAHGMIGGQLLDMENTPSDLKEIETIHSLKTSNLLVASLEFGATLAGAADLNLLSRFGFLLGLAFQILDDILDVTEGVAKHGKSQGSDASNQKTTSVTLLGLAGANKKVKELYRESQEVLDLIPCDPTVLKKISSQMLKMPS